MDRSLRYQTMRPLYAVDASGRPYGGLERFVIERAGRDWARGEGAPQEGVGLPGVR